MANTPLSRRNFLASGVTLAAATAADGSVEPRQSAAATEQAQPGARPPSAPIRILTMTAFEAYEIKKIESAGARVELILAKSRDEFRKRLPEADVVYGSLTASELPAASNLKWVQASAAGVESLDPEFMASPILLTNYARTFAPAISETAIGLLLCLTRGITTYYMPQFAKRQMKAVGTPKSADHIELAGKTMGIVGMGGIGSAACAPGPSRVRHESHRHGRASVAPAGVCRRASRSVLVHDDGPASGRPGGGGPAHPPDRGGCSTKPSSAA